MPPRKTKPSERKKDVQKSKLPVTNSPVKNEIRKNAPGVIFYGESLNDDYAKFLELFSVKYGTNPESELRAYHQKLTRDAQRWEKAKMEEWDALFKNRVVQMQRTIDDLFNDRVIKMKQDLERKNQHEIEHLQESIDLCISSERRYMRAKEKCDNELVNAKKLALSAHSDEKFICKICQDEDIMFVLTCGHALGANCYDTLTNSDEHEPCPYCRKRINYAIRIIV